MAEHSFAQLVARGRAAKGMSRQQLADAIGYSAVMIAKIESGERMPDEARIPAIADSLGLELAELLQAATRSDRRRSNAPKIVDAMKLARQNDERARVLRDRAGRVRREADVAASELREKVKEFDSKVLGPLSSLLSRIDDIPPDVIVQANVEDNDANPEFSTSLRNSQLKTGASVHALLNAGLLEGNGAATQMSSIAAASTGFVIMGLSDVPSTWSSLAEILTLAAPGVGAAAGKSVTTAIAMLPVALAVDALASGGRVLSVQEDVQRRLEVAQSELEEAESAVADFSNRASRIGEILTVALFAGRNHIRKIESALPADGCVAFDELDPPIQGSIRRMTEVMFACLTALSLPIGLNIVNAESGSGTKSDPLEAGAVTQIEPVFELGSRLENAFIDYVLDAAFTQVAR